PVAVAGVMGGANSEIAEDTKTLLFESASFLGTSVRMTAKKLGMRTESSGRFEKGLDPENALPALNRACELIVQLGAGKVVSGVIDHYHGKQAPVTLPLRSDKINAFLGTTIPQSEMVEILTALDFTVKDGNVTAPSFRIDIACEADIAEEIVRIYGYDNIPATLLKGEATVGALTAKQLFEEKIKGILIAQGLYEIVTYSFTSPKALDMIEVPADSTLRQTVNILNPLGEENSVMRTTTIPSMLEVLARNYNHRVPQALLFELGKVYVPKQVPVTELPNEYQKVTIGMYGTSDFYTLKGVIEEMLAHLGVLGVDVSPVNDQTTFHPGRTAALTVGGQLLGIMGEIHPQVQENYEIGERTVVAELSFDVLMQHAKKQWDYVALPKYPAVSRDIAMLVKDEILVKQIEDIIKQCAGKLLEEVKLFDVYKGKQIPEGMKSVAYAITFRANDRTLTDEEISKIFGKIVERLKVNLQAELRV
ncbi:MAG: phenylalanine--tRNA ligase subunit beta, partial [Hyphomonadaceae bacterium]|nr:phenylalanine--tRNA ligase subunit beta [Clostridia bacterium]